MPILMMVDATETMKTMLAAPPTLPVPTRLYQHLLWLTTQPSNTNHRDMSTIFPTTGERKISGLPGGTLCHSARFTASGRASKMRHGEPGPNPNTTFQPCHPKRLIGTPVQSQDSAALLTDQTQAERKRRDLALWALAACLDSPRNPALAGS
jgi:hypothetical protein